MFKNSSEYNNVTSPNQNKYFKSRGSDKFQGLFINEFGYLMFD